MKSRVSISRTRAICSIIFPAFPARSLQNNASSSRRRVEFEVSTEKGKTVLYLVAICNWAVSELTVQRNRTRKIERQ